MKKSCWLGDTLSSKKSPPSKVRTGSSSVHSDYSVLNCWGIFKIIAFFLLLAFLGFLIDLAAAAGKASVIAN